MQHRLSLTMQSSLTSPPSSIPTPIITSPSSIALSHHHHHLMARNSVPKNQGGGAAGAGAKPPPRPPNAWIIYRSDKLQSLPPPPLGQPKPTQAQVSKIISAQWRAESGDVRALYEQRAETAKVEHAQRYPDYRFAPVKKADRDRIREEKRQAKEQERAGRKVRTRPAPYPLPNTASSYQTSASLIIKHVVPNVVDLAAPMIPLSMPPSESLSLPMPPSMMHDSMLGVNVNVAPYYGPTRMSFDAPADSQFHSFDSLDPSFNETLRLGAAMSEGSSSMMPDHLTFSIPQAPPPNDWMPSPSAEPSPLPDIPLSEWPQDLLPSQELPTQELPAPEPPTQELPTQEPPAPEPPTQEPPKRKICALHFTFPSLDDTHMENELIARAVRSTAIPSVFPLHALANGDISVPPPPPPPNSVNMGMGMYPSSMSGSSAFDDPLRRLGEKQENLFEPTVEQLVATISTLSDSPAAPSPEDEENAAAAFNLDDFVKDFGAPASQEGDEFFDPDPEELAGEQKKNINITTTLSVVSRNSPTGATAASSSPHSSSSSSSSPSEEGPMPSFYVSLASPAPASTPSLTRSSHVVPANAGARRVGGTWKVPMAVSSIPSPNQVAV